MAHPTDSTASISSLNEDFSLGDDEMRVMKRNGQLETVSFDKILQRIKRIGQETNIHVNYTSLVMKVIDQLYDGISTTKIDELSAEQCASMASIHYDYNTLAGRIIISNHQKNTCDSFSQTMESLYNYHDKNNKHSPLLSQDLIEQVRLHASMYDDLCIYSRDYLIDYFGFKTLERAYLMKINRKTVERPQHMWLRVAIGIHKDNIERVIETYHFMSQKYFTHATPTLFNAGTPHPQLSSCFLLAMESDSIDGIYNTLKECAQISKMAGGIGLHIHNIRAKGSHIRGTNGTSNGIVPLLKVFNATAKYVDQCVPGNTIIYTTDGPMRIDNCIAGQTKVYNANGTAEVIQNVLEHLIDPAETDMVTIGLNDQYKSTFQITEQHPVLVFRDGNYEWVDAGDMDIGDKMVSVIPEYVPVDAPELKEMDCIMCGIIWNYCVCDIFNLELDTKKNIERYNEVLDFIREYFKYYSIEYEEINVNDSHYIRWKGNTVCPLRSNYFFMNHNILPTQSNLRSDVFVYDLFWHKPAHSKIIHAKILNLPKEKLELVVKYIDKSYRDPFVQFLKLRLSKPHGFMDGKPVVYNEIEYIVSIDDLSYKPRILLYDLQMEKQHDYLLEAGLVHNGGGRRNGSFAIYLEPWHADIESFLEMRKNHGDEELKARDLFYALWMPDLFMKRVKENAKWTLMCPDECPGLADVYGEEFEKLYESYESSGKGKNTILARDLWFKILDAQMETGTPYICYKDAANKKSNQKNLGTIKSSNLCSEIIEYSDKDETAVCNLASIALPTFVDKQKQFDYDMLHKVTKIVTKNLNAIIDVNYYPTEKTRRSNMRHRPIGIGVQGLADVFILMGYPFTADESKEINRNIFETMYHAALEASMELAQTQNSYETFAGSPASMGILQFDMWNVKPSNRYDWDLLKQNICKYGLRNSLLLAPMPTASTSQILGFNECIEPITSNIYSRRTLAGEFIQANKYLMADLMNINMWNEKIKNNIIANHGSIQHITEIPQEIKDKYKTVWELPMKSLIDMAADRGAFICQSQSLNLWFEDPNYNTLTASAFYSWSKGLKTGIYYLRRRGKHQAQQFTIEPEKKTVEHEEYEICEMCSS